MSSREEFDNNVSLLQNKVKDILDEINDLLPKIKIYLDDHPELFDILKNSIQETLDSVDLDEESLLEYSLDDVLNTLEYTNSCDELTEILNDIYSECNHVIYERQYAYTQKKKLAREAAKQAEINKIISLRNQKIHIEDIAKTLGTTEAHIKYRLKQIKNN